MEKARSHLNPRVEAKTSSGTPRAFIIVMDNVAPAGLVFTREKG